MTLPQLTDSELVALVRGGDVAAVDELYRRYVEDARRAAWVVARSDDEAEVVAGEAVGHVLALLRADAGPNRELRPYLRTCVRRLAIDRYRIAARAAGAVDPVALAALPDLADPITVATHRDLVRKAYETLPANWQQVLWRTEVEGRAPAALAASFQSTPDAVAALAYRAREGLRQAYLSMHLIGSMRAGCKPFVPMIPALTRGTLAAGEEAAINAHLGECGECRERQDEMLTLLSDLRGVLVPALLGVAGGPPVHHGGPADPTGPAAAGAAGGQSRQQFRYPRHRGFRLAGAVTAAAGLVAVAVVAVAMLAPMLGSPPAQHPADPRLAAPTEDSGTREAGTGEPVRSEAAAVATVEPSDPLDDEPEASGVTAPPPATATPETPAVEPPAAAATPEQPATARPAETPARTAPSAESASGPPAARPGGPPTETAAPTAPDPGEPGESAPGGPPPWLCDLVPRWPGCPDDPQISGSDALCVRIPTLPFCPAD